MTTLEIAQTVGGELIGSGELLINAVEPLDTAGPRQLTFIRDQTHASRWAQCAAAAAIIGPKVEVEADSRRALIRVRDADLAMATVLAKFAAPPVRPAPGVHASAVVHPSARLGSNVAIGAHCFVGEHAQLGDGCILHPNVTLLAHVRLGDSVELFPGVVIRERCIVGHRVILHSHVVIGADGFGYRPSADGKGLVKIPHMGAVEIGDDVEIGANSCVDRGKFGNTTIGAGTKIDNLCQIAHNCRIGRSCVIAGLSGIAGSTVVGDGVQIGGHVGIRDHTHIGAGASIAAYAAVMNDIPAGETWGGYPAQEMGTTMRQVLAVRKLPDTLKRIKKLEEGRS